MNITNITKETHADLFVLRMQGMIAAMLLERGVQPTDDMMALLRAKDFTIRDLSDAAFDLGFGMTMTFKERPVYEGGNDDVE